MSEGAERNGWPGDSRGFFLDSTDTKGSGIGRSARPRRRTSISLAGCSIGGSAGAAIFGRDAGTLGFNATIAFLGSGGGGGRRPCHGSAQVALGRVGRTSSLYARLRAPVFRAGKADAPAEARKKMACREQTQGHPGGCRDSRPAQLVRCVDGGTLDPPGFWYRAGYEFVEIRRI